MQVRPSTALLLGLLMCACAREGGNGNAAAEEESATVPVGSENETPPPAGEVPPARQPANGAAQAEPASDVALTVTPEQATEDSTVTLALRNGTEQQVGYNLCTSTLHAAGGREIATSRVCTMELRTLEPGRTAAYRYELPVNMAEGSYRVATQVHWMGSNRTETVRSNAFEVRSD